MMRVSSFLQKVRGKLAAILLHENWMIGVIDQPIANAANWTQCPPIRWLTKRSSKGYYADPFAWPDRSDLVLCEYFDFKSQIGSLRRLQIEGDRVMSDGEENIPLPDHLSFPFLFAHEGEVYALPESAKARTLTLFRWDKTNALWQEVASPLVNKAAADSILFKKDGLFWIAYTDVDLGAMDNLNLLYAADLAGPWTPHAQNPVARGLQNSRCGGTPFWAEGFLYRPAQDCSQCYGGALRIMRIIECSPALYREEEVSCLLPADSKNPHGVHSLCAWGDRCLVDGKRMMFSPALVARKIAKRIVRIGCRLVGQL